MDIEQKLDIKKGKFGKLISINVENEVRYERYNLEDKKQFELYVRKGADNYEAVEFTPEIIDMDGRKWACSINIAKLKNKVICRAYLGAVGACNTDISVEEYALIQDAILSMNDVDTQFRMRDSLLSVLYGIDNLEIKTLVEIFGYYLGFMGIIPADEWLAKETQYKSMKKSLEHRI